MVNPAGYDHLQRQLIPGYGSLARLGVALLAASPLAGPEGAEVLVAGCGTGPELQEAVAQRPDWRLTAIDPSEAMLTEARSRLAAPESIHWHPLTVEALAEDPAHQSRYAGALSVLVLQSLADDGQKLAFLSALARTLAPTGQLVLVDLMQVGLPSLEPQLTQAWLGFQRASGLQVPAAELQPFTQGLHPVGLARLTSLVNAAGFGDPARIFQALGYEGFLLQRRA